MHKMKRKMKDAQLVLGEGKDKDWARHSGPTTLILKNKQNLNSK